MSPTFQALRIRNYRLYATGGVVSNVGTWMQRVAQDWLVLQLTGHSGVALGITTGLQFLPMLLLAPFAGSLADRYPKRKLLMATQAFMADGRRCPRPARRHRRRAGLARLRCSRCCSASAPPVDAPARQSFVIEMVGRDDLPNAVGLNSASFNLGRVIGPALAGLLIVLVGTGPVFLINAASFGAVIVALTQMRVAELMPMPRSPARPGAAAARASATCAAGPTWCWSWSSSSSSAPSA